MTINVGFVRQVLYLKKKKAAYAAFRLLLYFSDDFFGRKLQYLRMLQVFFKLPERQAQDVTGTDAVVRHDTERQTALKGHLSLLPYGDLAQIAHRKTDGYGAEVIDMMMDRICFDAGKIGQHDRAVEGAGVDDRLGTPVMLIQPLNKICRYAQQSRRGAQELGELIGRVDFILLTVLINILRNDLIDRVDGGVGRELHLAGRTDAVDLAAL